MHDNKLFIFDLDGVLVESKELHFITLNEALKPYGHVITRDEHEGRFDGMSTDDKLKILNNERGLNPGFNSEIWQKKQKLTEIEIERFHTKDEKLISLFTYIKSKGIRIAVASNAIGLTMYKILNSIGVDRLVDYKYSSSNVKNRKPHPEIYLRCMVDAGSSPGSTVIFEDSHIGRTAAAASGAHYIPIKSPKDINYDMIKEGMNLLEVEGMKRNAPWRDKSLNVLIPMAGAGSRFAQAGYTFPKPLIEINGKPMIQIVTENLNMEANFIYIVQREHNIKYNIGQMLKLISPGCHIIETAGLTKGAACTTLLASELINTENPLIIANSDQFVEWNSSKVMYQFSSPYTDAGILTFKSTHPKWSFAKIGSDGYVTEVAEKKPISDNATVGIYYWRHGMDYVNYAIQMINKGITTNGEYYVAPVFNEAIADGKKVRCVEVEKMWGLGVPEDLQNFMENYKGNY